LKRGTSHSRTSVAKGVLVVGDGVDGHFVLGFWRRGETGGISIELERDRIVYLRGEGRNYVSRVSATELDVCGRHAELEFDQERWGMWCARRGDCFASNPLYVLRAG
jgi:hypothetical protein